MSDIQSIYKLIKTDSLEDHLRKALKTLKSYTNKKKLDTKIPKWVLKDAKGIGFLTSWKMGYAGGVEFGNGFVMIRKSKHEWSYPLMIKSKKVSIGPQIGCAKTKHIFVLNSKKAVKMFLQGNQIRIGVDLSFAAGPLGRHVLAQGCVQAKRRIHTAHVWSYSLQKGVWLGTSLNGEMLKINKSGNKKFYFFNETTTTHDILTNKITMPYNEHYEKILDILDLCCQKIKIEDVTKKIKKLEIYTPASKNKEKEKEESFEEESSSSSSADEEEDSSSSSDIFPKFNDKNNQNEDNLPLSSDSDSEFIPHLLVLN